MVSRPGSGWRRERRAIVPPVVWWWLHDAVTGRGYRRWEQRWLPVPAIRRQPATCRLPGLLPSGRPATT